MKTFSDLTEQELLALAISSEEDDARGYAAFANALTPTYAASAKVFLEMSAEEFEHRDRLTDIMSESPGLKARLNDATPKAYQSGRRRALEETGLMLEAIPELCPYTWDDIITRPIVYDPTRHRLRD